MRRSLRSAAAGEWGYQFFLSLLIDLGFYAVIIFGLVSAVFGLTRRWRAR